MGNLGFTTLDTRFGCLPLGTRSSVLGRAESSLDWTRGERQVPRVLALILDFKRSASAPKSVSRFLDDRRSILMLYREIRCYSQQIRITSKWLTQKVLSENGKSCEKFQISLTLASCLTAGGSSGSPSSPESHSSATTFHAGFADAASARLRGC